MMEYKIEANKERLECMLEQNPDFVRPRVERIDEFFKGHGEMDIAILLTGGKIYEFLLASHITLDNIQYLNPPATDESENGFHSGALHPDRALLLFDDHVSDCNTVSFAARYFVRHGYELRDIYVCAACGVGKALDIVICPVAEILVR
jgi:hypothetical protein